MRLPLVGVVLGALLAGGTAFLLERARERRAARAAALLVRDEMKQIWTSLDISVGNMRGEYVGTGDKSKEWDTSQWHTHRTVLAAGLTPDVWGDVADAYRGLRHVPVGAQPGGLLARRKRGTTEEGGRRKPVPPPPLRSSPVATDSGRRSDGWKATLGCP